VPGGDDDSVGSRGNAAAEPGDHVRADPAGHSPGLDRQPHSGQAGLGQGVAFRAAAVQPGVAEVMPEPVRVDPRAGLAAAAGDDLV